MAARKRFEEIDVAAPNPPVGLGNKGGTFRIGCLSRRCGKRDMTINLTRRTALIGLSSFVASRVRAQTNPPSNSTPDAAESVSLEAPAVFDITPTTGTLKETVQKG